MRKAALRDDRTRRYMIAVLVSVYHREDPVLFKRAMLSVLNQEFSTPVTVRVYLGVDGPVSEALDSMILRWESRLHKVVRFTENRGLVHVLNELIACRTDEEFFFRMDTDDVSHPERFDRQIKFMVAHPEIDILGTDIVEVHTNSAEKRTVHFADDPDDARRCIAWRVPVAHPTVCFRASVFDRVPGYPVVLMNEDISMWFACLKAGMRFHNIPEPLYEFTINDNFWGRRGLRKSWLEFKSYAVGLWKLEGITWRYVFPLARLLFRLLPATVQRFAYGTKLRTGVPTGPLVETRIGGRPAIPNE
jgi:glycosyltransferase involved in cell wall biosynthesis